MGYKVKGTTKSGGNKDKLDKFYTKPEIVDSCLQKLDLSTFDYIIEPSAGSGAFSSQIDNVYAYDLEPDSPDIIKADWFQVDKSQFSGKVLVVGNPPFGTNGSLASKFIIESSKIAHTIAFILPKSFKKPSLKERLPLNLHLVYEEDLPEKSFLFQGKPYGVPCVFQIWEKRETQRTKEVKRFTSEFFKFSSKGACDFRVQRVGGNAGKASNNLNVSSASNYFIKNTSRLTNTEFITLINSLTFPSISDTAGPKSLSKQELIHVIEQNLK